uniref:tRNA(Ile)-lysidine synthase, chloroplastic n=1 Tax=Polysiphonia sertularioides TaxID=945028 RepID=A0A1Z1MFU2_9FLOR|nr:tRNA Ile-lysidine synthetase [Polysiphonia sertularioides]
MSHNQLAKSIEFIEEFIERQKIKSLLVAFSGGQDSAALMHILEQTKQYNENKIDISYIYIDHQWRKNSYKQTKQMINYMSSVNSRIVVYQIQGKMKSENSCRIQRYHTIIQHALKSRYELIITGHHNDDKIETFFQNIYRGCGIEGINSLVSRSELCNNIFLLRPILDLDRYRLYWLCKKMNLPIWSDNTNYFYSIKRNRLRNELIPYIENFYCQHTKSHITYLTKIYYYENEYIKQKCIKLYLKLQHRSRIAINYNLLAKNHFALQTRVLQLFIFHNFRLNADVHKVLNFINNIRNEKVNSKVPIYHEKVRYFIGSKWIYVKIDYR